MLKFKINVADALSRIDFSVYDAKKTGFISQDTIKKFMAEDTSVTLDSLNKLCVLLDMEIKDIIAWEMSPEDAQKREAVLSGRGKRRNSGKRMVPEGGRRQNPSD